METAFIDIHDRHDILSSLSVAQMESYNWSDVNVWSVMSVGQVTTRIYDSVII